MKKNGIKTTCIIRDVSFGTLRGMNRVMVEYRLNESTIIIAKEITVAGMPYKAGDSLPMYYDRNDPEKMLLDSGSGFSVQLLLTILLAAFVITACYLIYTGILSGEL